MSGRGRKPKPVAVKRREGNLGKRRLPTESEEIKAPEASADDLTAPAWLGDVAAAEWDRVIHGLVKAGLYTSFDRVALEMYCAIYEAWRRAEKEARSMPPGHPAAIDARKYAESLHRLLGEFGFTPSSRARLAIPKDPKKDKLRGFIDDNRRNAA